MQKNSAGVIVSVKDMSEVTGSMVHCSKCGRDFIPSLDCDSFFIDTAESFMKDVVEEEDSSEEKLLQCEYCLDDALTSQGVGVIDMRPDGVSIKPAKPQANAPVATTHEKKKWWQPWKKT